MRAAARALFRREWFPVVDAAPAGGRMVRAYDLAAVEAKAQAATYVRKLADYDVKAAPVTGDKVSRAGPASAQAEAGNIRLVRGDWNDVLDELEAFPTGRHDDWVDALADAINELALGSGYTLTNL